MSLMSNLNKSKIRDIIYNKKGEIEEYTDENGTIWWNDFLCGWICNKPDRFDKQYSLRGY